MSTLKKRINLDEDAVNQKLLTCVVCQDTFDQSEHAAKQLTCNHTLCKSCLKTYCDRAIAEKSFSFLCPLCRKPNGVTPRGVAEFSSAFLVNQLLDLIKEQNCELVPRCSRHQSQELLFCDTCSNEFCDTCDASSHINHDKICRDHFIIPSSFAIKRASKNLTDTANKCITKFEEANKNVSSEIGKLDQTANNILENIDLKFAKIISSAEKRCTEVKTLAKEMHATKRKILQDQLEMIKSEKDKVEAECDKIKGEGSINQINRKVKELCVQRRSLCSLLNLRENWFINCDHMEESSMDFVQASIQSIGSIRSSTTCPFLCEVNIGECFARVETTAEIITYGFSGERQQCGGDIVTALFGVLNQDQKFSISVIDRKDGTYQLKFIPTKSTTYQLWVKIFDHPIKTYPLEFEAKRSKDFIISRGWASPSDLSRTPKKIYHLPLFNDDMDRKIRCATSVSLSSQVWLCASGSSSSQVYIMDMEEDHEIVHESFIVPSNILCIASIPIIPTDHVYDIGKIDETTVKSIELNPPSFVDGKRKQEANKVRGKRSLNKDKESEAPKKSSTISENSSSSTSAVDVIVSQGLRSPSSMGKASTVSFSNNQPPDEYLPPSSASNENVDSRNSAYMHLAIPTVWLGGKDGTIHIYREEENRTDPLTSIKLPSPIVQIIHYRGKVFVVLVDGLCCIFTRLQENGFWDLTRYFSLDMKEKSPVINGHLQKAGDESTSSEAVTGSLSKLSSAYQNFTIRCMETVGTSVWLGYRNAIYILDCESLRIENHFEVDSREKARITQITAVGDGAWCSTSLDSRIHLYSASQPYQHLQSIDVEPNMKEHLITESYEFGKIIAMKACYDRLWIGTNRGAVMNIPYVHQASNSGDFPASLIPECNANYMLMLSLYGHGEMVKFFLQVKNFMISGGDGYHSRVLDEKDKMQKDKRPHLIVWRRNC